MAESIKGLRRTDYCGVFREADAGREVTVFGWVQRQRDLGQLIFVDLRDRTGIVQIRPMLYIHEKTVDNFAVRKNLPVIENRCPVDKTTKRTEVKSLVYELSKTYPDLKERIFGAMQRYPLEEWEPRGRYKRPKEQE